eukprot:435208-Rhodomonas_salina.2
MLWWGEGKEERGERREERGRHLFSLLQSVLARFQAVHTEGRALVPPAQIEVHTHALAWEGSRGRASSKRQPRFRHQDCSKVQACKLCGRVARKERKGRKGRRERDSQGSFPGLRNGTKGTFSAMATGEAYAYPLLSMPTTAARKRSQDTELRAKDGTRSLLMFQSQSGPTTIDRAQKIRCGMDKKKPGSLKHAAGQRLWKKRHTCDALSPVPIDEGINDSLKCDVVAEHAGQLLETEAWLRKVLHDGNRLTDGTLTLIGAVVHIQLELGSSHYEYFCCTLGKSHLELGHTDHHSPLVSRDTVTLRRWKEQSRQVSEANVRGSEQALPCVLASLVSNSRRRPRTYHRFLASTLCSYRFNTLCSYRVRSSHIPWGVPSYEQKSVFKMSR